MVRAAGKNLERFLGRAPEELSMTEQAEVAGLVAAFEIYTPATLPVRVIAAIGESVDDCVGQLVKAAKDPRNYEFVVLKRAW